jgi:hypothetical protein
VVAAAVLKSNFLREMLRTKGREFWGIGGVLAH